MSTSQNNPLAHAWADHSRVWRNNLYVYPVISRRAGGISIGINLNPDKNCTFDCPYCQVDRSIPGAVQNVSLDVIAAEIENMITAYRDNGLADFPSFSAVPASGRILRDLCLSGDGESTMAPEFPAVCTLLRHIQNAHADLNMKLVLITNATLLDRSRVHKGLTDLCTAKGEIWGKLDAGTEEWFQQVNISRFHLDQIEKNLQNTVKHFPMRIQTMLCTLKDAAPSEEELMSYVQRVSRIHAVSPENFLGVQLYSVVRSTARPQVGAVSLNLLEHVADLLREAVPDLEVGIYP